MSMHWPVAIMTVGASRGGCVLFRKDGKLHLTIVLKNTLRLVPDQPMEVVAPNDLFVSEVHYRDNPTRSIRATSDVVPYLPRVDVVLTGHAHAPSGQRVPRQTVSLAIYHGIALLEKKLEVVGDRVGADIVPFDRMPLIYEKAFGGIGDSHNPWGTGAVAGSAPPNIVNPKEPNVPAGFGPISRALRQRKTLRGNVPISVLDESLISLPANFDWNYFQAAPTDQQLGSLIGNEWVVIEGMHPTLRRISSRLPSLHPIASIFGINPEKPDATQTVHGRIDILRIDADNLTCSVVCRAVVPIEDERSLATMRIVAAVETEDHAYSHLLMPPTIAAASLGSTVNVAATKKQSEQQGTLILGDSPTPKRALPFAGHHFDIEDSATIDMDIASHHEEGQKPATPFPLPGPKRQSATMRAPIPGAPWSPASAQSTNVSPTIDPSMTEVTLVPFDEPTRKIRKPDMAALAEPPPRPVIPPAPIPEAPPPVKAPAVVHTTPAEPPENLAPAKPPEAPTQDFWAKTGNELPLVTAKPPPPRIPAKPAVNKSIYGGFGPPKKKT